MGNRGIHSQSLKRTLSLAYVDADGRSSSGRRKEKEGGLDGCKFRSREPWKPCKRRWGSLPPHECDSREKEREMDHTACRRGASCPSTLMPSKCATDKGAAAPAQKHPAVRDAIQQTICCEPHKHVPNGDAT